MDRRSELEWENSQYLFAQCFPSILFLDFLCANFYFFIITLNKHFIELYGGHFGF